MMKTRIRIATAALLALGACEQQPDPLAGTQTPTKPPKEVCAQVTKAMERLTTDGGMEADGQAGATMMEEAWLRLDQKGRDQVMQVLAFDAACRAPEASREQMVRVRSEYGRVMAEQIVETSADFTQLAEE